MLTNFNKLVVSGWKGVINRPGGFGPIKNSQPFDVAWRSDVYCNAEVFKKTNGRFFGEDYNEFLFIFLINRC